MRFLSPLFLLFPVLAFARPSTYSSDLHLGAPPTIEAGSLRSDLQADRTAYVAGGKGLRVNVFRVVNGANVPVRELPWRIPGCAPGESVSGSAELSSSRYSVGSSWGGAYRVVFSTKCGGTLNLYFDADSGGGQALGAWHVATAAKNKLAESVGLDFWKAPVRIVFPANSNYYTDNTVNVTRGDQWDVVAHELGHAVYDQAKLGEFGGGFHRLTNCYTDALALSEGWATYFGAWAFLSLDDPDARLEFIGGIRMAIENVPGNVCQGPTNEWRVAAFFWDLIDRHDDGEGSVQSFAKTFQALQNRMPVSTTQAAQVLVGAGVPARSLDDAWESSFLTRRP